MNPIKRSFSLKVQDRVQLGTLLNQVEPEYQTVLDRFTVQPTSLVKTAQNTMIKELVAAQLWTDKLDAFYFFAAQSRGDAYLNWIKNSHNATDVGTAVDFTEYRGVKSTTAGRYLNSNFNPKTQGIKFVGDNQSIGVVSLTDHAGVNGFDVGWYRNHLAIKTANASGYGRLNTALTNIQIVPTVTNGLHCISRTGGKMYNYCNGLYRLEVAVADNVVDNHTLSILSEDGAVNGRELAIVYFGGYLTKDQHYQIATILKKCLDAMSLPVIAETYQPLNFSTKNICVVGDSIVADYTWADKSIGKYFNYLTDNTVAAPGNVIAQQKTAFSALSAPVKAALDFVFIQVGRNDILAGSTSAQIIAALQDLLDTIRAGVSETCKILISTLIPVKEALSEAGHIKMVAINDAIMNRGDTPITDADYRAEAHTIVMNDPATNYIKKEYQTDATHPNAKGRYEIAKSWYNAINV